MMTTATKEQTVIIQGLNKHLATALDLASQLKQAHWNIVGPNFISLHELFDKQRAMLVGYIDEYGERIRALGGVSCGTVRQAAEASELPEFPGGEVPETDVVRALAERFEAYSALLARTIVQSEEEDDLTTQDLYIEVQREVDRNAWFLRSHLA